MLEHKTGAGQNWFDTNFFGEKAIAPAKRRRAPSPIPDTRLLFQIQDDLLKAIAAHRRLPMDMDKDNGEYERARKAVLYQLENSYKLINRYLRHYVNNEPS